METLPEDVTFDVSSSENESEDIYNESQRENDQRQEEGTFVPFTEDGGTVRISASDSGTRSSFSGLDYSRLDNVWILNINGGSYKVLFPKTEDLVIVDGVLVNVGSSNITGVCLDDTLDVSTYFRRTFTVMPLTGSSAQNNANNYGAHAYMTVYSQGQYQSLTTTQQYGDARVTQKPRFGSTWSTVNIIIIALLALQVLISFIGGLIRRG